MTVCAISNASRILDGSSGLSVTVTGCCLRIDLVRVEALFVVAAAAYEDIVLAFPPGLKG